MPLTNRQKRRLIEISTVIESSLGMKDNMFGINQEYANELEQLAERIRTGTSPTSSGDTGTDLSLHSGPVNNDQQNSNKTDQSTSENQSGENLGEISMPEQSVAPEWAKKLWKQIAKACHPDRLNFQSLTAIEINRRQTWFLEARELFENEQWNKLLHIGVQLGIYIDDIAAKEQLKMLNTEYSGILGTLEKIQSSIAWKWGTNWDNLELRIKILTVILQSKGIVIPSRLEMIQHIMALESD